MKVGKQSKRAKRVSHYLADQGRIESALEGGATLRRLVPLQYRKILKKCFWSVLAVCVVWGTASVFVLRIIAQQNRPEMFRQFWAAWIGLLLLGLLWATGIQIIYFIRYFYDIDERSFTIRKGVVAQTEITLPFSKITDVYVDQDVLDVLFGLYDVHISSPTEKSGALAHVDGLNKRGAVLIRALVLDRIHQEVDAMAANPASAADTKLRPA